MPPTKRKHEQPKPVAEATPAEVPADEPEAVAGEDFPAEDLPTGADETDGDATEPPDEDEDEDTPPAEPDAELVEVRGPCRKCYPDGWPAREKGASASCFHGLAVVFGQANYAPRDIAHACDLV